jgi:HD-GYP domain-containing protein (c-di-GMP phosphodiesterase class II)
VGDRDLNQTRKLHLQLVTRLVAVAVLVSTVVGALVFRNERNHVEDTARDRATVRIGTLRVLLLDKLDAGELEGDPEVERALRAVAYKGLKVARGHYVLLRVFDGRMQEIARSVDAGHPGIEALVGHAGAHPLPALPESPENVYEDVRIAGHDYIRAVAPMTNSRGEVAACAEGFFSTTPEDDAAARRKLLAALGVAVGTVLGTTLLLYPIILSLLKRLARLSLSLLDSNLEMLQVIGRAIAKRDSDTDAHNYRVTVLSARIGEALRLDDDAMRSLVKGALLHDVGKIGITDTILLKPGRLDEAEFTVMKQHVNHGLDIVNRAAWLHDSAPIVGGHHEKFDGSGYFRGLKGEEIPLGARIFAIADVFDAVTSHRPYHKPMGYEDAMGLLMAGRGTHFDPALLDVFAGISKPLYDTYADRDDQFLRDDHAAIIQKYYRADLTTFLS